MSKLFEVIVEHPTLQHIAFGVRRTLSKEKLIQIHSNAFPICSSAFIHLVKFLDSDLLTEISLNGYSMAFEDCARCNGSGVLARKHLSELVSRCQKLRLTNTLPEDFSKTIHKSEVLKSAGDCDSYPDIILQAWASDRKRKSITIDRIKLTKIDTSKVCVKLHYSFKEAMVDRFNQVLTSVMDSQLVLHELSIHNLCDNLVKPVCHLLENCRTLYALVVKSAERDGLIQVFQALQGNCSLRELSVGMCYSLEVAKSLSEMIIHNSMILTLTISGFLINEEFELIARSLLRNFTLQNLYTYQQDTVDSLNKAIRQLRENDGVDILPNWNLNIKYKY